MDDKLNLYTKDELLCLGIYELRDLGRDVGVKSPTTLKKEDLVDKIVSIIYGEVPKRNVGKGRGRPVRAKDKPSRIYVDLIDKIEAPKCESSFIFSKGNSDDFNFSANLLSSRVASASNKYVNDSENEQDFELLKNGVVCEEDGKVVVRKFKFIKSNDDVVIPNYMVEDYKLKDNDIIDYILDDDMKSVIQLFKINGKYPTKSPKIENLSVEDQEIYIEDYQINLSSSNLINISTVQDRNRVVDKFCNKLDDLGYSFVKVCFDRTKSSKTSMENIKNEEIFANFVGDEFETIAMAETAIEKAVFHSIIEGKTVLVIDNLSWLAAVLETYPDNLYGNFIEKMAKTCKNSNISLVCFAGYLSNEKVSELKGVFDYIN